MLDQVEISDDPHQKIVELLSHITAALARMRLDGLDRALIAQSSLVSTPRLKRFALQDVARSLKEYFAPSPAISSLLTIFLHFDGTVRAAFRYARRPDRGLPAVAAR